MAKLLMFNLQDARKREQLRVLSIRLDFACIEVPASSQGHTLRQLLSGDTGPCPAAHPFAEELIVMNGFLNESLDTLLQEMRKSGTTVSLKAVVTATNQFWTADQLAQQLKAEDYAMRQRKK